ncbi:MAG: hypothetical protein A3G45_01540 [Candidatus Staskawiczbacteria bacterium RIFCSPLOWO2_12_FULL_37_15]|uniref:Uncharacterized protein n=1 Tax=Candidatus Staskawiczbacteria bacterium RIFCSPLOWO2_12_FULL_37_15 TaxID=1802218 RepID=A0A1G2IK46_9BACT|nr:MAG: hypothetical protein A3G45_01540 [Candidatus Staskawiczbacteria bacterium RIFCSPLOWO2_12_FULL_37_15]
MQSILYILLNSIFIYFLRSVFIIFIFSWFIILHYLIIKYHFFAIKTTPITEYKNLSKKARYARVFLCFLLNPFSGESKC